MKRAIAAAASAVAAAFASGCASVARLDVPPPRLADPGLEAVETVDVRNTNWLLLACVPLFSGDPARPDVPAFLPFRNAATVEGQMEMLEAEARLVGATRAVDVATYANSEAVLFGLFVREKLHTTAVLARERVQCR